MQKNSANPSISVFRSSGLSRYFYTNSYLNAILSIPHIWYTDIEILQYIQIKRSANHYNRNSSRFVFIYMVYLRYSLYGRNLERNNSSNETAKRLTSLAPEQTRSLRMNRASHIALNIEMAKAIRRDESDMWRACLPPYMILCIASTQTGATNDRSLDGFMSTRCSVQCMYTCYCVVLRQNILIYCARAMSRKCFMRPRKASFHGKHHPL